MSLPILQPIAASTAQLDNVGDPGYVGSPELPFAYFEGNPAVSTYFRRLTSPTPGNGVDVALDTVVDGNSTVAGLVGQRSLARLNPTPDPTVGPTGAFEGSERWYHTYLYFPASFEPSPDTSWNIVLEWHNYPNNACCANIMIAADTSDGDRHDGGEALNMRVLGGADSQYPIEQYSAESGDNPAASEEWYTGDPVLQRDHWYDVLVHVKWSYLASNGLVEWWLDGRQVVSAHVPTLFWYSNSHGYFPGTGSGPGQAYFMEGYYRPSTLPNGQPDTSTADVLHAGTRIGPTLDSVR